MASYDLKAIFGEKLKRLTDKTLKAIVDCMCTVAASLCSLENRLSSVEQHLADTNIGDRVADSLDAQSLKVGGNDVADSLSGKADKASSGNGNLAVIDANGNFASSGIAAYNQSQINSRVEGKVFPALQDSSFVREKDFIEWYDSENEYFFLDFENEYDSDQYLRLGLSFTGRYLAFRLPTGSAFNQWIFAGQSKGDTPVGLVEMYTSVIKNTNGNISTNVIRSSPYLDIFYEGGAVKRAVDFGSIDLGATSTAYASDSSVQIVMNVRNRLSGKMITISLTFGFTRFAAGAVYTGFIVGTAKVVAYNFNGIVE